MGNSHQARAKDPGTPVPFPGDMKPAKPWDMNGDTGDDGAERIVHFGIDVTQDEDDFLEWYAAFRNAQFLARTGKKLRRQRTRKTMAETLLTSKIGDERKDFAEMFKDLGQPPDRKDQVAMLRYAKRVLDWSEKRQKDK